nr:class II aldolase/adducin family protein [Ornithinimicrobium sp. HY1793]
MLTEACSGGRHLESLGLSPGSSGNISVRVGDRVHISATGQPLGSLSADQLSVMELTADGLAHVDGPRPSKEHGLHGALYHRDPDAVCVVHLHSTHAVAASCLPPWNEHSALPPLTPYLLMRVGNLPLIPYHPPGDADQAQLLRELDIQCHGALLQNHGPVVAGRTVSEAVDRAIEIELASQTRMLVGQAPGARLLTDSETEHLTSAYGQPWKMAL